MAWLKFGLKALVTAVTFYVVASAVSPDQVLDIARRTESGWLVLAAATFLVGQVVSSQRHRFIIRRIGGQITLPRSVRIHFVGLWFNQVFPTSLGGDIVKIAMLRNSLGTGLAVHSVILDRISGLMVLLLSIVLLFPWYLTIFDRVWISVGLAVGAFAALAAVLIAARFSTALLCRCAPIPGATYLLNLLGDLWKFRKGAPFYEQFWTSTAVHVSGVLTYALIGKAIYAEAGWLTYFLLTPLLFLITLIPISLAGWGVRELGAVWLFGAGGVAHESALLMSVLFGLLLLVTALPGGLLLLTTERCEVRASAANAHMERS
jgi:uncharacterized membrane protein YbhN (UPF0104 family)